MRRLSLGLLLVFVFTIPWQAAIPSEWRTLLGAIALLSAFTTCFIERRVVRPPAFFFAVLAFICWQLASYFWSVNPEFTVNRVTAMVPMFALVWLVIELGGGDRERSALLQAFVFGCIVLSIAVIQSYSAGGVGVEHRYAPTDFSLNESADMLAAGIAMALLNIAGRPRGAFFWVNIGYVPLGLFGVVLTGSRSGFVLAGAATLLGVFLVLVKQRAAYRIVWLVVFLGVLIGLFFGMAEHQALQENLKRVTFSLETSSLDTLTGRTTIWSTGLESFKEHLFTGTGAGTFRLATQAKMGWAWSAHSLVVETAVEGGIIGLGLLTILLATAVTPVVLWRNPRRYLWLLLFLVLIGTSLVANFTTLFSLWFGFAIIAANASAPETQISIRNPEERPDSPLPLLEE